MKKIFKLEDQINFSNLSADYNPIHLDKNWAESEYPGKIVVYGILLILWAIESSSHKSQIIRIRAKFIQPVIINDEVQLRNNLEIDKQILSIYVAETLLAKIECFYGEEIIFDNFIHEEKGDLFSIPKELSFKQMSKAEGIISVPENYDNVKKSYPNASKYIGIKGVKGLLAISRMVGMYCPGLRSIFSSIDVFCCKKNEPLKYKVTQINKHLGFIRLKVNGLNLNGEVTSYFTERYKEKQKNTLKILSKKYQNSTALIIGNKGLANVVSDLLLENSAKVFITSRTIKKLSKQVIEDNEIFNNLNYLPLDVRDEESIRYLLEKLSSPIKSLYYFPSPRIFRRRLKSLSSDDLNDYLEIYVVKFIKLVEMILNSGKISQKLIIGYPSSIAIEHKLPEQFEYYSAKKIGEYACEMLSKKFSNVIIKIDRLPRLSTRQTNSFLKVKSEDNYKLMSNFVENIESLIEKF